MVKKNYHKPKEKQIPMHVGAGEPMPERKLVAPRTTEVKSAAGISYK
jgi:hypothetical protein